MKVFFQGSDKKRNESSNDITMGKSTDSIIASDKNPTKPKTTTILDLLRTPKMRARTLNMFFLW